MLPSRLTWLLPVALHAAACVSGAQIYRIFPFIKRADPAVERHIFVSRPELRIEGRRIGVLPFRTSQRGEPAPPPLAPFLREALSQLGTARALVDVPGPVASLLQPDRARNADERRIGLALERSKAASVDLMATGQIDALFRTASGGMVIKVSGELWDVDRRIPVWSGRITVDWIRRYPLEDCLLRAAIVLVEEWERASLTNPEQR